MMFVLALLAFVALLIADYRRNLRGVTKPGGGDGDVSHRPNLRVVPPSSSSSDPPVRDNVA